MSARLQRFRVRRSVFLRPTFASAARQAQSRCLAASGDREGAGTCYADLENGIAKCTEDAFEAGLAVARAGVRVNEIGRAIEQVVKARGFTVIRSLSGHGVGRTIHEPPTVPNYHARRQADLLTDGLVITIEPLICVGAEDVFESADGWTIKTRDGSLAAHFEHCHDSERGC